MQCLAFSAWMLKPFQVAATASDAEAAMQTSIIASDVTHVSCAVQRPAACQWLCGKAPAHHRPPPLGAVHVIRRRAVDRQSARCAAMLLLSGCRLNVACILDTFICAAWGEPMDLSQAAKPGMVEHGHRPGHADTRALAHLCFHHMRKVALLLICMHAHQLLDFNVLQVSASCRRCPLAAAPARCWRRSSAAAPAGPARRRP